MKAMPPSLARPMPICSPETACMTAETMGTFMVRGHSSPFLNFTTGVFKVTLAGMHSAEE